MRWLKGVIARSSLTVMFFTVIFSICFADDSKDPGQAASDMGKLMQNIYGTRDNLNQNVILPMLNENKPMSTLDKSISFKAQLLCPSSEAFTIVSINYSSNGISTITVQQDLDLDGTVDTNTQISGTITSVCSNGFIACLSQEQCYPYKWTSETSGKILYTTTGFNELSGCYCISSTCNGAVTLDNFTYILKSLGGGVIGAVMQSSKNAFIISDSKIQGNSIVYYGQKTEGCSKVQSAYGKSSPQLQNYFDSPQNLQGGIQSEVAAQSGDSASYYNLMVTAQQNVQESTQEKTCVIQNVVNPVGIGVYDVVVPFGGYAGQIRSCGDKCIQIVLGIEGDNYWCAGCSIYETYYDIQVKRPDLISKATLNRVKWDDWIQIFVNNSLIWYGPYAWTDPNGYPPGSCELDTSWDQGPQMDVTQFFRSSGILRTKNRVAVSGCGEGFSIVTLDIQTICELNKSVNNTCSSLENDPNCTLRDEYIDDVPVMKNFIRTGFKAYPSCKNFSCPNTGDSIMGCEDWWETKRVYVCKNNQIDLSDAKKRLATVVPSVNDTGSNVYYQDWRKTSQGEITDTGFFTITNRPIGQDCEPVCKVKKLSTGPEIGISGPTSTYNKEQRYTYFYRACIEDTCPTKEGETVVEGCKCSNDFNLSTSTMAVLRQASQDMKCTNNNYVTLP